MGSVQKDIMDDFILDVRRIVILTGSQRKASERLGVGLNSVARWFRGESLPSFRNYIKVRVEMDKMLTEIRGE